MSDDDQKTTLRGLGDCNACGWREELGHIRTAIESLDRQLEGIREDYRSFRKTRDSVANLSQDQIGDSTPPGRQQELRVGPVRVRGRYAVAAVVIAVTLVVGTALMTRAITPDHITSVVKQAGK